MLTCVDVGGTFATHLHVNEQRERTALMWAAKNGRSQCVEALVEARADMVVKDIVRYYAIVSLR